MNLAKTIVTAMIGISCFLAGCAQKPKQLAPSTAVPQAAGHAKKDSGDIFNEFYNDSAVTLDKAKNIKTFALKPSGKAPAAATEANSPGSYTPAFSDNGPFTVQAASMRSRALADELATEFREKGYPSYVLEVQNPTPTLTGAYYRVRIGGFATSVDAKAFCENILVPAHFDYWIDRKANETGSPLGSQLDQGAAGTSSLSTPSYTTPLPTPTPPPATYESTVIPGPGTVPAASSGQSTHSSTGGWSDSSAKW